MVVTGLLVASGAQGLMLGHHPTAGELHRDRDAPGTLPESHRGPTSAPMQTGSPPLSPGPLISPAVSMVVHSLAPEIQPLSHTPSTSPPHGDPLIGLHGPVNNRNTGGK